MFLPMEEGLSRSLLYRWETVSFVQAISYLFDSFPEFSESITVAVFVLSLFFPELVHIPIVVCISLISIGIFSP
jgi:hypothetical protein